MLPFFVYAGRMPALRVRLSTFRPPWSGVCTKPYGLVHSAHSAHTGVAGGHRGFGFLDVAEDALGGQQHTGNRGGVLESDTGNLGGVNDTAVEQLLKLLGAGIVAVVALAVLNLVDDDAAFKWGQRDRYV